MPDGERVPGIYFAADDDNRELVHEYLDGDYRLTDIAELFFLGQDQGENALMLSQSDVVKLKVHADAESFDHEPGFIEMCLDIFRFASKRSEETLRFVSIE